MTFPRRASLPTPGLLALFLGLFLLPSPSPKAAPARDAAAIARVESGDAESALASWWGPDPDDATDALQAAIRSRAKRVVVPFTGRPWILRPIVLRSDLELVFEPGVLVLAKPGEFQGGGDSLFLAVDCERVTVRGYGAVLRMRKADYQKPPYAKAEWRMGLKFAGCKDVKVEGVRIESSGGDGIYIGSSRARRWCENVILRDCISEDHHRQGLSVISAMHLLVERCTFSGTSGTPPEAGIDFEPDEPDERLVDCIVRDCVVSNNAGNGILVYLKPLDARSEPVSIRFERCHVRMGPPGGSPSDVGELGDRGWSGFAVGEAADNGSRGWVEFVRCTSSNTGREAVRLMNKSAVGPRVRFIECHWQNPWLAHHRAYGGPRSPILFRAHGANPPSSVGGVDFVGCTVRDALDAPTVRFDDETGRSRLADVTGRLDVENPNGARVMAGPTAAGVTVTVAERKPEP